MFSRWLSLAILLCPTLAAGAERIPPLQSSDLPPIDPPGVWHTLTQDDATSDSKCIGKPMTPLCAVETVKACHLRVDVRLCEIGEGPSYRPIDFGTSPPRVYIRYRVVGAAVIAKANRNTYTVEYVAPRIGDIVVQISSVQCHDDNCHAEFGPPTNYILRQWDRGWYAADWVTPRF